MLNKPLTVALRENTAFVPKALLQSNDDGQGGVPVIPAKAGISGLYLRTISLNE